MLKTLVVFICGGLIGGVLVWKMPTLARAATPAKTDAKADAKPVDIAALDADVTHLKGTVPTLSHVMADVAFQYSNLWFAGQHKNWPLAAFYLNETRGRIKWLLRINPTPKTPTGEVVNLQGIYDGLETSTVASLKDSIDKKDSAQFVAAYKQMLEGCYSCHKAAGRPYLRPMIPTVVPQTMINYDPDATWPK